MLKTTRWHYQSIIKEKDAKVTLSLITGCLRDRMCHFPLMVVLDKNEYFQFTFPPITGRELGKKGLFSYFFVCVCPPIMGWALLYPWYNKTIFHEQNGMDERKRKDEHASFHFSQEFFSLQQT